MEKNKIYTICVSNDLNCYRQCIQENPFCAECCHILYDNRTENVPISVRYNHFIEHSLPQNAWLIFMHQDFEWKECPSGVLAKLNPNFIYGPIGTKATICKKWKIRFGVPHFLSIHKHVTLQTALLGQIWQGPNGKAEQIGTRLSKPKPVDTVDCCCLIVHSSLIFKHKLRFDPVFDFHLYSEDFSLAAKQHGINTYACQISCRHISQGNANELFWHKYRQLLQKYPNSFFLTTCAGVGQFLQQSLVTCRAIFQKPPFQGL